MGPRGIGLIGWIQSLRNRPVVAATLVTVLTLALVGGVILSTTSVGCGAAQKIGLKGLSQCKQPAPVAGVLLTPTPLSPTATPVAFNSPSPQPVFNTPSPTPVAPVIPDSGPASGAYPPFAPPVSGTGSNPVTLSCRLPAYVGPAGSGGFIVFPGGKYIADPKSAVTVPSPSPGSPSPAPGYGQGYTGLSYDRAYSRWLPAPYTMVSPDGTRYAHASPDSVYVENVVTGATTELAQGHAWTVIDVENQGVYATIINQAGLWFLPYSGGFSQLASTGYWQLAAAGFAYGSTTSAVPQGFANTIIRRDLKTGAETDWFTRGGGQSYVIGFDARGNALISVNYFANGAGSEVWITTSAKARLPIFGSLQGLGLSGTPVADSHGVWFPAYISSFNSSTPGIALYVAGKGLYWMSSIGVQLGGGCN